MHNAELIALLNMVMLPMLLVVAAAALFSRRLFVSVLMLSIYSLLMALIYLLLGAPDVAMTEAAVGAGISTILLLSALSLVDENEAPQTISWPAVIAVGSATALLLYATIDMPLFGDVAAITNQHVANYYIASTQTEIGIPNMVTAVLASYRGYDTFGETIVIFTAAIAVLMLLDRANNPSTEKKLSKRS